MVPGVGRDERAFYPFRPLLCQAASLVIALAVTCSLPLRLSHVFLTLQGLQGVTDMAVSAPLQTMMFLVVLGGGAYLVYRGLIWVVFGDLRAAERMRSFDRILTFLLVKVFIMTGMLDSDKVYHWRELQGLVLYTASLACTGLIKHLTYISQERLEHLMSDPSTGTQQLSVAKRTVMLLVGCMVTEVALFMTVVYTLQRRCPVIVPLLLYDGIIAFIEVVNTTGKYVKYLREETSDTEEDPDENAQPCLLDMAVRLAIQGLSLAYYLHIWLLKGPAFKLVDGVLLLVVRSTLVKGTKVLSEYHAAKEIAKNIDSQYPDAGPQDLAALSDDDICAICLKSMKTRAKKLPCQHLFHGACIRQCMEKGHELGDPRCPLCRKPFGLPPRSPPTASGLPNPPVDIARVPVGSVVHSSNNNINNNHIGIGRRHRAPLGLPPEVVGAEGGGPVGGAGALEERSIFRLTSESFPAWVPIPSFAFEIVRRSSTPHHPARPAGGGGGLFPRQPLTPPGMAAMMRQVSEVLPQVPREVIRAEVARTGRVDIAIETLLGSAHRWDQNPVAPLRHPPMVAGEPFPRAGVWSIAPHRLLSALSHASRRLPWGAIPSAGEGQHAGRAVQTSPHPLFRGGPTIPHAHAHRLHQELAAATPLPTQPSRQDNASEASSTLPILRPHHFSRHPLFSFFFSSHAAPGPPTAIPTTNIPAASPDNTPPRPPSFPEQWRSRLHWVSSRHAETGHDHTTVTSTNR